MSSRKQRKHRVLMMNAAALLALLGVFATGVEAVTLDECIQAALRESPDALVALERVQAAGAMIRQAESAFYPRLNVGANWARTDNPPQAFMMSLNQRTLNMADPAFNPNEPDDTENVRLTAGAQWRLFDGKRLLQRMMSRYGKDAAEEQYQAVRNELVYQVIHGYYRVLQAQDNVRVQQETVESLDESLRVANERFNAGSVVKTDVLNLEVSLAQAREDLIRAKNGVRLSVAALNMIIGRDLVDAEGLPSSAHPKVQPPPAEELDGVDGRPEYRAVQLAAQIKRKAYVKAMRAYYPEFNAFGSYDWDSDTFSDFEDSYMVGVMASWDVFTGFQRPAHIAQAKAEWRGAAAEVDKVRNQLTMDLKQAYIKASEAYERMGVSDKSLQSAEEALRITSEQYRQGAADITILLTAQVGLTATQMRNVSAHYDYIIASANIQRARGQLAGLY